MSRRYTLQRKLGAGGMGDVWEGLDTSLGRRVAIKTIKPELAADPQMFARFRQEAEAAASLGHPNIIQVIELTSDDPPLLVMEMLEGKSLRDLIREEGRLTAPRACFIALQMLSALAAAHGARIVHRDIKPANVFVVRTLAVADFVKVLDFGIAKLLDRTLADGSSPLTAWGDVLGTTAYMAPEQALGMPVDARADLFAVGAVLFEMLSGTRARPPGPGGKANVRDAAFAPCRKLGEAAPSIDPALAAIVDRALMLDPTHRFASAEEMVAALSPFAQAAGSEPRLDVMQTMRDAPPTITAGPTITATSTSQWQQHQVAPRPAPKGTHWALIAIPAGFGVLVVLAVVIGVVLLFRSVNDDEKSFVESRKTSACDAPRECRAPDRTDNEIAGVRYGACMTPALAPPEVLTDGDVVFVEEGRIAELARIVGTPDQATYRIEKMYGAAQTIPRTKVIGRICVRSKK